MVLREDLEEKERDTLELPRLLRLLHFAASLAALCCCSWCSFSCFSFVALGAALTSFHFAAILCSFQTTTPTVLLGVKIAGNKKFT
ncbi:hypothetical protein SLEP1_g12388 [Rubroshorea leprosula]|uniref:Uncharacterized protein n=1 Tax=Rubroshorea leprosula TaxID=152421 RepID=A0AAV5ICD7_9ROSI|nr:hypothetical protein SLEP1_g12388 [Rubroshorea leprosula]